MKAKGQLTKANQTKTKMENLARELQKVINPCLAVFAITDLFLQDNKKLRVCCLRTVALSVY
jgi:hypothetical protein